MQDQQTNPSKLFNILCSDVLENKQVTFTKFMKLQTHKTLYKNGVECKYITNLLTGGKSFIRLYAIFQNNIIEQLGEWEIHANIQDIIQWDKCIVISSAWKVVGLIYDESILKNAFMISLQFLYLNPFDKCELIADNYGKYLILKISKFVLICISAKAIYKYRSKPLFNTQTEIINEDCKWNRPDAQYEYISEIVKVKVSELELINLISMNICQECLYILATVNQSKPLNSNPIRQQPQPKIIPQPTPTPILQTKKLYYISIPNLFVENRVNILQFHSNQDTSIINVYPIHLNSGEVEYLLMKQLSLQLSTKRGVFVVEQWQPNQYIKIWNINSLLNGVFPIYLTINESLWLYERVDDTFKGREMLVDANIDDFDSKDSLYAYCKLTEVVVGSVMANWRVVVSSSIGRIVDYHVGKTIVIVEYSQSRNNKTRLGSVKRKMLLDRRIFVTHSRKIYLEKQQSLSELTYFKNNNSKYLTIKRGQNISLLKEVDIDYLEIEQGFCWVEERDNTIIGWKDSTFIKYTISHDEIHPTECINHTWKYMKYVWLIDDYIISWQDPYLKVYCLRTNQFNAREIPFKNKDQFVDLVVRKKNVTFKKKDKDHFILEVIYCSHQVLEIWEVVAKTLEYKLTHHTQSIGQGLPILYHYSQNSKSNKFRSVTLPEYILNYHQNYSKSPKVISFSIISNYLLMVTDNDELLFYQQSLSSNHQLGYIYRRIPLPMYLLKNIKSYAMRNVGCQMLQVGNYAFTQGIFIEPPQGSKYFFIMDKEMWVILSDGKIRMVDFKGEIKSNYIVSYVDTIIKSQIIGLEVSHDSYCVYSSYNFQVLDRDLKSIWNGKINNENQDHREMIVKMKIFNNLLAMSYYDYYEDEINKEDYQSIKFKFRIYNILTKSKIIQKDKSSEEPIIQICFIPSDKLLLLTPSNIFINVIRSDNTLQTLRTANFGKRSFISGFSYLPQIVPTNPGFMLFGGKYGGLSFHYGQWIEKDQLWQYWFDGFKMQIRDVQLYEYGHGQLKAFITDEDGNVIIAQLKNKPLKCHKIADFHLSTKINKLQRNNQVIYASSDDGFIRSFTPIKVPNFDVNYLDFQNIILKQIPFLGGFNQMEHRLLKQHHRTYKLTMQGNMVDVHILKDFFMLTKTLQEMILEEAQLNMKQIKANILAYC